MNQAEIYNQEWCKDLIRRLGRKKELEARSDILAAIITRQGGPSSVGVAKYGESTKTTARVSDEEIEFDKINFEIGVLNAALNSLEHMDKMIIELKYVEKVNDWHITELAIPKRFFDGRGRPLYITDRTMRTRKRKSLIQMGKLLGYRMIERNLAEQLIKEDSN